MMHPAAVSTRTDIRFRCHLCGGSSFRVIVSKHSQSASPAESPSVSSVAAYACTNRLPATTLQVVECRSCSLRALHPAPSAEEVERAYAAVEDPEYTIIEAAREIAFQQLLVRLHAWRRPPGRLVDVGCYTGIFPRTAQAAGWDAYGVEPSAWAADRAAERLPGKITSGFLPSAPFAPASFDVVTSWDVIEHVTDPRRELARMAALLRPGGWLFLSTMKSDAGIVRLLGSRWPWYMEMHRFYFTPKTLGSLFQSLDLHVRAVEPYPHLTNLRYLCWKLESVLGPLARFGGRVAQRLGVADRVFKIDLGDFFLIVAQRP